MTGRLPGGSSAAAEGHRTARTGPTAETDPPPAEGSGELAASELFRPRERADPRGVPSPRSTRHPTEYWGVQVALAAPLPRSAIPVRRRAAEHREAAELSGRLSRVLLPSVAFPQTWRGRQAARVGPGETLS